MSGVTPEDLRSLNISAKSRREQEAFLRSGIAFLVRLHIEIVARRNPGRAKRRWTNIRVKDKETLGKWFDFTQRMVQLTPGEFHKNEQKTVAYVLSVVFRWDTKGVLPLLQKRFTSYWSTISPALKNAFQVLIHSWTTPLHPGTTTFKQWKEMAAITRGSTPIPTKKLQAVRSANVQHAKRILKNTFKQKMFIN